MGKFDVYGKKIKNSLNLMRKLNIYINGKKKMEKQFELDGKV